MEVLENIDTLVADVLAPENLGWVMLFFDVFRRVFRKSLDTWHAIATELLQAVIAVALIAVTMC